MLPQGTGWIPDRPDPRDYGPAHPNLVRLFERRQPLTEAAPPPDQLPPRIDLRPFFPAVFEQGPLNSCTAATAAALIGFLERRLWAGHGRAIISLQYPSRNLLVKPVRGRISCALQCRPARLRRTAQTALAAIPRLLDATLAHQYPRGDYRPRTTSFLRILPIQGTLAREVVAGGNSPWGLALSFPDSAVGNPLPGRSTADRAGTHGRGPATTTLKRSRIATVPGGRRSTGCALAPQFMGPLWGEAGTAGFRTLLLRCLTSDCWSSACRLPSTSRFHPLASQPEVRMPKGTKRRKHRTLTSSSESSEREDPTATRLSRLGRILGEAGYRRLFTDRADDVLDIPSYAILHTDPIRDCSPPVVCCLYQAAAAIRQGAPRQPRARFYRDVQQFTRREAGYAASRSAVRQPPGSRTVYERPRSAGPARITAMPLCSAEPRVHRQCTHQPGLIRRSTSVDHFHCPTRTSPTSPGRYAVATACPDAGRAASWCNQQQAVAAPSAAAPPRFRHNIPAGYTKSGDSATQLLDRLHEAWGHDCTTSQACGSR